MISERAWAEVDVAALRQNLEAIRSRAGADRAVMLVVKADAYGHGLRLVAATAQSAGIEAFGVRDSSEALELRANGIARPILVLGTVIESELDRCLEAGIEIAIHSADRVRSLRQRVRRLAGRLRERPRVHLNVDTGMGRLGLPVSSAPKVLDAILAARELELVGIMTHLARPEGAAHPFTREQCDRFARLLEDVAGRGVRLGRGGPGQGGIAVHIANSAGIFTELPIRGTMVRPGIAAYGVMPRDVAGSTPLAPVMSLRAQIVFMKDVPKGTSISYAQDWVAPTKTRIATIPVGYYDGIPWRLKGNGFVLVRGQRAPLVGRITMDYVMADIGQIRDVRVGDPVTFFGRDGEAMLPVTEIANALGTIPYEITCAVGSRVRRIPVDRPRSAAQDDDRSLPAADAPPPGRGKSAPARRLTVG